MPELDVYYPSITIKAYESRGFGCFKYAGVCTIPSIRVFLEQLITEEEYDGQIYESKFQTTKRQPTTVCKRILCHRLTDIYKFSAQN